MSIVKNSIKLLWHILLFFIGLFFLPFYIIRGKRCEFSQKFFDIHKYENSKEYQTYLEDPDINIENTYPCYMMNYTCKDCDKKFYI